MHHRWESLLFGVVGGLLAGGLLWWVHPATDGPEPRLSSASWPVVNIVQRADPAVVAVLNEQRQGGGLATKGLGSGVAVNARGDIVTNYHVVARAAAVVVVTRGGHRYRARLLGVDPATDLAVLQIADHHLPYLPLAQSSQVQPGELVVAIGQALGLSHSVTAGIVSAPDRTLYRDGWSYHLIQTDAAINPGNSGGPLVNQQDQIIGINSSKIARTGVEGIGFSIPSDTVRYVLQEILRYGYVRRPWVGIQVANRVNQGGGLLVIGVYPGSPAAHAGIRPGDLVLRMAGRPVKDLRTMVRVLEETAIGTSVSVVVGRGSEVLSVHVKLSVRPTANPPAL